MRRLAMLAVLALAACGLNAPAPSAPPAAADAAAQAEPAFDFSMLEGRIVALGDQPNWRLDADAQLGMVLVMPEQGLTFSADFKAPTHADGGGATIVSPPLTLVLRAEPCTSAGVAYPMRASAQVEQGEPLAGCAFVRWDRQLIELLPAIDACIARAPTNRRVTYAATDAAGVLVRLQGEGAPLDCHVGVDGTGARTAPSDANLRIGGDGDAIFVRAPGENPGGECYEAPEVHAADGALLGWMDDPLGC